MKLKRYFRRIILALVFLLLLLIARPLTFLVYIYFIDKKPVKKEKIGYTNDASNLNETKIKAVVRVPDGIDAATLQISQLIKEAKARGLKISIAGAQHSMGGHTIYPDGIQLDMKGFHYMEFDSIKNLLLVGSGALWSEIIPYLDKRGKSIAVMQSNNSFSVGGSISVNCHGWQPNSPPISSTIESFRIINADGEILNCSKSENTELFSLAIGGYGLFGVILDVKLRVVSNRMYKINQHIINSSNYIHKFQQFVTSDTNVGMAYGRININPEDFMNEAIISTYLIDTTIFHQPLQSGNYTTIKRTVFRGSANSAYGKNLRWKSEEKVTRLLNGKFISRNQLINEGVEVFQNTDTNYTDILHEYFIPKDSVFKFIESLKKIIPSYNVDLLNITIRNVKKDTLTFLRYAKEEVFGFVMLFNQPRNSSGETEMRLLTQKLIDSVIALNGTYYLPYRLHATKEQMYKAYPQAKQFFILKKKYDPDEIFQNRFYETYK